MLQLDMGEQRVKTLLVYMALPSQRQAAASSPAWHGRPVSWSDFAYFLALELLPFKSQLLQAHSCTCCSRLQDSGVAAVSAPVSPSLYSTCLSKRMGPT